MRSLPLLASALLALAAASCVPWTHVPAAGPRPASAASGPLSVPSPASLAAAASGGGEPSPFPLQLLADPLFTPLLDGSRPALAFDLSPVPRYGTFHHRVYSFSFPSAGANRQPGGRVSGRYFAGEGPGRKRLVLVLPVYGSSTYPAHKLTQRLLLGPGGEETNVLLLDGEVSLFDWPTLWQAPDEAAFWAGIAATAEAIRATAVDVRRLLDWAEGRPEIDPSRLGLAGFSIGAIVGAVVLGVDDRPAAAVLAMGGGDLPAMFSYCYGKAARARENAARRFAWSEERFAQGMARRLAPVDPLTYASGVDPRRVLWLEAARDDCVPPAAREQLWQRLGRPEKITLDARHRPAFYAMTFLNRYVATRKMWEFLDGRLGRRSQGGEGFSASP